MGISHIKTIHQQLSCSLNKLEGKKINLYIDAMINLFVGVTESNIALDNCPFVISNIALDSIATIIKKFKKIANVDKIIIYFDGRRPFSKNTTSEIRRNNMKLPYQDYKNTKKQLIEASNIFVEKYGAQIEALDVGEAEVEMFLHRDPQTPSVFVTRDSDMISLCYNYEKKHKNDLVYWASQNELVDFDNERSLKFNCISKIVTYLFGNDYCTTFFTQSCAVKLFDYLSKDNITCKYLKDSLLILDKIETNLLQSISDNDVSQILIENVNIAITTLCKILIHLYAHHDYKLYFYRKRDKANEISTNSGVLDECINYSKSIAWNLNYHFFGKQFSLYDINFYKKSEFSDNFKILSNFLKSTTTLNSAKDFKAYGKLMLDCESSVDYKINENEKTVIVEKKPQILTDISNYIAYAKCKNILTSNQLDILHNVIAQNTKIRAFYVSKEFKFDDHELHLPIYAKTNNPMHKFADYFVFNDLQKNSKEIKFKE